MSPLEVSHRNIVNLLKIIADALQEIAALGEIDKKYATIKQQAATDAKIVGDRYRLGVSPYIVAYVTTPADQCDVQRAAYCDFIGQGNIVGAIDGCMRRLEVVAAGVGADQAAAIIARRANFAMVPTELERVAGDDAQVFEAVAAEEARPEPQCDAKTKQGRHHPRMHCKAWVSRLQAWDGPDVPKDEVIKPLQACCRRDRLNRRKMTCAQIRKYLKELGLTSYNVYVPFIRKVLTGIAPPQLTQAELDQLYNIFDRMAATMKRIRPDNNITYYPFIIYKILDSILPPGNRKAQILECIHLQSNKTMRLVDKIYAPICCEIDELKAKPTNKHEYNLLL